MLRQIKLAYRVLTNHKAKKEREAREGKTTSGFLSPGERQRMFRNRPK